MPKRFWIPALLIVIIAIGGCAKRNTAYQEEEWLTLERRIPVVGDPLDFCIDDDFIYVAQDQGGISTISRSNYQHEWYTRIHALDGSAYTLQKIRKIDVVGSQKRLFLNEIGDTDRFIIMDTTNPDTLVWVGNKIGNTQGIQDLDFNEISTPGTGYTIEGGYCAGGVMYYTRYNDEFWFVNEYSISPPATASGFFLTNNHIYIAAQQRGLVIYNRATQQMLSELAVPGSALKVKVRNNIAYIASRQGGLSVVDVTVPTAPVLLASFPTSNFTTAVDVSGTKAAISAGSGGVYLYDVSNPNQPRLLQRITSCGYANTVKFMGDKLVVAGRDQGILVYKIK